jgi:hypothetical protein
MDLALGAGRISASMSSNQAETNAASDGQAGRAEIIADDAGTGGFRRTLLAAAILLGFTLVVFADVLFVWGDRSDTAVSLAHNDIALQYAAWRDFGFTQLRHGHFPLWNPHIYSGAPYFGGMQSGLLYPLNFQYLFLPLARAINAGVALHVFLGGLFMYLWARQRRLKFLACLFCGVLWMFCGQHYCHIMAGHLTGLISTAWLPLLFLTLDGLFEEPPPAFTTKAPRHQEPPGTREDLDSSFTSTLSVYSVFWCLGVLVVELPALSGRARAVDPAGIADDRDDGARRRPAISLSCRRGRGALFAALPGDGAGPEAHRARARGDLHPRGRHRGGADPLRHGDDRGEPARRARRDV